MLNTTQRDTIQGLYDALATRLAHVLETGQREGVLRACDFEVTARIILSLVTWAPLARPWAHQVGPMGHARLLAAATAAVFDGFSRAARLPDFQPLDLAALAPRHIGSKQDLVAACYERAFRIFDAYHALMLPGLVSWLVKEDVPRAGAQQRHIAQEVANLVALGLRQRD